MSSSPSRLADSHIHLFQTGYRGNLAPDEELQHYELLREKCGVGPALVVGYEGEERYAGNNAYIRQAAQERDWMFPLRYVGQSNASDVDWQEGFWGYALYLHDWPGSFSLAKTLNDVAIGSLDTTPLVSINGTPEMLDAASESLSGFQDCRLLISHLGLPGQPASTTADALTRLEPLLRLAESTDVYVKISGLYSFDSTTTGEVAEVYVRALLQEWGAGKLLWGSDFAPILEHWQAEDAFALPEAIGSLLSADEADLVTGQNLVRLLGS